MGTEIVTIIQALVELLRILTLPPSQDRTAEEKALFALIRAAHDRLADIRFGKP